MLSIQKKLFNLHKYYSFLPERKKIEKCNELICDIQDKENCVYNIRVIKQALNQRLILKTVHKVIQFNQEAWMKPYIDMNNEYRNKAKSDIGKDFFNFCFWKNNGKCEKAQRY